MKEYLKLVEDKNGNVDLTFESKKGPYLLGKVMVDAFNNDQYEPIYFFVDAIAWFLAHEKSGKMQDDVYNKIKELATIYRQRIFSNIS